MSNVKKNNDMNVGCITNQNLTCYLKFIFFHINKHLVLKDIYF